LAVDLPAASRTAGSTFPVTATTDTLVPAAPSAACLFADPVPAHHRKCKEVKCKRMTFKDGYGAELDRNGACFDDEASVVVTITDTCPCYYPGNAYSNKRWCCGDMYHL
jgi:hypothetical protein